MDFSQGNTRRWLPAAAGCVAALASAAALKTLSPDSWWGGGLAPAALGHVSRLILGGFFFVSAWALGDWLLAGVRRAERAAKKRTAKQKGLSVAAKGTEPAEPEKTGRVWTDRPFGRLASLRVALGLTLLSLLLFGLAAWGLWSRPVFWAILVLQGVVVVARWPPRKPRAGGLRRELRGPWALAGVGLSLVYVVPSLLVVLSPPTGWDDQVYHLPLPKAYLEAGGFFAMPWNFFAQQPGAIDLLFGWGLALGDGIVAALIHFGLGVTVGVGLWETARRLGFRRAAWFAPPLFFCHFMVGEEMGWAFSDVGMAAFLLPGWWVVWQWARGRAGRAGWLVAGLVAGMVCASKYTGALSIAGIGVWMVLAGGRRIRRMEWDGQRAFGAATPKRPLARLVGAAGFGALGFLMLLPWLVKNWAFTGNPVWPLMYARFGGAGWSEPLSDMLVAWQRGDYGPGRSVIDWALLLPRMSFFSSYESAQFAGSLAAWPFVGAAAGLVLFFRKGRAGWAPLGCFAFLFLFWAIGSQQSRFLIPALPLLALAALPALDGVIRAGAGWRRLAMGGILAAALAANLSETALPRWKSASNFTPFLAGRESREAFLTARVRSYACFRYVESLPAAQRGRHVVFLFEPMGLYAEFPYRFDVIHASPLLELAAQSGNGKVFARSLQEEGVRLVVVNHEILDTVLTLLEDPPGFPIFGGDPALLARYRQGLRVVKDFLESHAAEQFRAHNSAVYQVKP